MMMNLQELQTVKHHGLEIKTFLLNNNGYLTIKHTHDALFNSRGEASATSPHTGVSFPDFSRISAGFEIAFRRVCSPERLDDFIQDVLDLDGAVLAEVVMPEYQELIPKSSIKVREDGSIFSPPLEDLYPFLSPSALALEMGLPVDKVGSDRRDMRDK